MMSYNEMRKIQKTCNTPKTFVEIWEETKMNWNDLASALDFMASCSMLIKNGTGFEATYQW